MQAKTRAMRANSLWFRLIASSAVIAIVLLVSAAVLLNAIFVQALEHNFDQRLKAALDGVLATVELGPDGNPKLTDQLADTRFNLATLWLVLADINAWAKPASWCPRPHCLNSSSCPMPTASGDTRQGRHRRLFHA